MRIFINPSDFISVIKSDNHFDCQVMTLVHGFGMYSASIMDDQHDVVSCIVHEGYTQTNKKCRDLQEIADFHLLCMKDSVLLNQTL